MAKQPTPFKRGRATRTQDVCPYKQTKVERNVLTVMEDFKRTMALVRDKLHEARELAGLIQNAKVTSIEEADDLINANATATIDVLAALTSAVEYLALVRE
jgi:hypothetical protein